jgi:cytochrome P450
VPNHIVNIPPNRRYFRTPATAPGPAGPNMLKAFGEIRRSPMQFLFDTWQEYGDVVQFPIPSPPSYLVNDPDAVRQVLIGRGRDYDKDTIQYRSLSLVTGEGLLTAQLGPWRRQRPLVQPAFHHETLHGIVAHISDASDRLCASWDELPDGSVVDIDAAMMHAALEVVGHALFGTDLSADADVLAESTLSALEVVVARARVPLTPPQWLPTPANRRLQRAVRELDRAVDGMLAERGDVSAPQDMLDLLIMARDDHGQRLSKEEIRDQIVTFIVAGHETVASALTWAWALLARRPELMEQIHVEAAAVLGGRAPTLNDLADLPFARAVFDETLRLYPPAWLITRKAMADDVLGGWNIPAGALIIMSPYLLHRHPAIWSNPEEFDPARFIHGDIPRTAFIPFGAGLRQCIGKDFAYVEGVLMLAGLAQRYTFSYPPGVLPPEPDPLVTIRPKDGLRVRINRRG